MTGRFGHFGLPALLLAAGGVAALILHLAVPYAHVDYNGENAVDAAYGETLSRDEAAELHDDADMAGLSSPGWTLAGTIILTVAGLAVLGLGYLPMGVDTARWIGWGAGALASVGGLMALVSSFLWAGSGLGLYPYGTFTTPGFDFDGAGTVGFEATGTTFAIGGLTGGFTGLVELVFGTDNAGTVVIIGPVLVTLAAATAVLAALALCGNVSTKENGVRQRAQLHLNGSRVALLFLAIALVVPWSIGEGPDYNGNGDTDYYAHGAHTVLNTEKATDGELWGGLTYAIHIVVAAAWIGVFAGIVGSLGGVLASTGASPALARATHWTVAPAAFMLLWTFLLYILAWSYMWKPHDDLDGFQPGYFPALLLAPFALWTLQQARVVRRLLTARSGAAGKTEAVAFD